MKYGERKLYSRLRDELTNPKEFTNLADEFFLGGIAKRRGWRLATRPHFRNLCFSYRQHWFATAIPPHPRSLQLPPHRIPPCHPRSHDAIFLLPSPSVPIVPQQIELQGVPTHEGLATGL